jgi:hypothetical protein
MGSNRSFYIEDPANVADLLLFGPLASYCVILIGRMRTAIEREQAERALRASKDRLQLCLNAARLGWWQYDPLRRTGSGDARANEIHDFDIAEDEEVELEELLTHLDFWPYLPNKPLFPTPVFVIAKKTPLSCIPQLRVSKSAVAPKRAPASWSHRS